jgi:hypothetical protein
LNEPLAGDTSLDVLILLAIRECFALFASSGFEDPETIITQVEQIAALNADTEVNRQQIERALVTFRDTHDPVRRNGEAMNATWGLLATANPPLERRLVAEYAVSTLYVDVTPKKRQAKTS